MFLSNSSTSSLPNQSTLLDKKSSYLLAMGFLFLLFLPKVNLVSFGRETAGIRVDDLLLFSFSTLFFWASFSLQRRFSQAERQLLVLIAFSLISFLSNRFLAAVGLLHVNASIFYAVRLFEYFLFFYVGILASPYVRASSVIKLFLLWNCAVILLQKAGLVGGFSVYGYMSVVPTRYPGVASFPSEMGVLFNIAYSYLIFSKEPPSPLWRLLPRELSRLLQASFIYWLTLIVGLFIVLTGSRIALVALALTFAFRLKEEVGFSSPGKLLMALFFIVGGAFFFSYIITKTLSIYERSAGLFTFDNIELIKAVWNQIDIHYEPIGNEVVERVEGDKVLYDASWWMRMHKWGYATKIYVLHPECWLQGIGPGFAMAGLDGGYLRILTEYGVIGCVLFWRFFAYLWSFSRQIKWIIIAIMVNMIFFDVYLAYKPMAFLFLLCGYHYASSSSSRSTCLSRV